MSKIKKEKEIDLDKVGELRNNGKTWAEIAKTMKVASEDVIRKRYNRRYGSTKHHEPSACKVLIFDIETLPIEAYVWGTFDQNIGLDMVKTDWSILSFSAKWLGSPENEVMYYDTRNEKNIRDDSKLLKIIHSLLDECDITITQNGVRFDIKKLNARFIKHGMKPPSSFRNIDTLKIAKKHFGFTSNKLAYMTDFLCTKYKKLDHSDFSGFKLWNECMKGNLKAFESMKKYNIYDTLSLEELYNKLAPWDNTINFALFLDETEDRCSCGSSDIKQKGFKYTNTNRYKRLICQDCGKEYRGERSELPLHLKRKMR